MSRNKFYFVIFLLLFSIGVSGCADKSPVSNLSDGRDGKIYFYSTNATFKEYINNQELNFRFSATSCSLTSRHTAKQCP